MRLLAALALASCCSAWDGKGHRVIACIAYQELHPSARARVDAILLKHPDYATWSLGSPAGSRRGLRAFLDAAVWPDSLRRDTRFHGAGQPPTPLLDGFPDMLSRSEWHFINIPYAVDGVAAPDAPTPNAVTQIELFQGKLDSAYNLAWMLHLVGDLHQPLHAVQQYSAAHPKGERGGGLIEIAHPVKTLHGLWDGFLQLTDDNIEATALELRRAFSAPRQRTAAAWARESHTIAREFAYTLPAGASPTAEYESRAREIARRRVAEAGFRLAALLNRQLRSN